MQKITFGSNRKMRASAAAAAGLFWAGSLLQAAARPPADVQLMKTSSGWELRVDGKPFFIQGVGCNSALGSAGEDYLEMAKELGANAVRTWGDTSLAYLDRADQLGLKVAVGFWLNAVRPETPQSYQKAARRRILKERILRGVRRAKNNPAVLLWGVGTEVFSHTRSPQEKKAFAAFLSDLIESIHREDPHHPIFYGSSDQTDLPDVSAFAIPVDLIGIDTYGAPGQGMGWLQRHSFDKPAILAEFGPHGAWDVPKDKNGVPFDPSDALKAADYEATWHQLAAYHGRCLGGFAFVLGEPRNQDSVTWFNINDGARRRKAYWTLYHLYTGLKPPRPVPQISEFIVDAATGVRAGQRFGVRTTAAVADHRPLTYSFAIAKIFSDPLIVEPPRYTAADPQETAPGAASLRAPEKPGVYRVYARVSDPQGNVAIADRSIRVLPR